MLRATRWPVVVAALALCIPPGTTALAERQQEPGEPSPAGDARLRELAALFPRTKSGRMTPDQLDRAEALLEELVRDGTPAADLWLMRRGIVAEQMSGDRIDKARALAAEGLAEARRDHEANPDDDAAAARLVESLQTEINLARRLRAEGIDALEADLLAFLEQQLDKHPGSDDLLGKYVPRRSDVVLKLTRRDPAAALASYQAYVARLAELKRRCGDEAPAILGSALGQAKLLERAIETERKRLDLVGKPAIPLDATAWANGSPITWEDLRGKVVLLDFWAVWCRPCIATFPHLREWHETHGARGLQIIGVTKYYRYGWNAETARPERAADLAPEDERKALDQFAAHHRLGHPFAIVEEGSTLYEHYGVSGIPQAVLIDKQGVVRLIQAGSGAASARKLGEMIETLLAE